MPPPLFVLVTFACNTVGYTLAQQYCSTRNESNPFRHSLKAKI